MYFKERPLAKSSTKIIETDSELQIRATDSES